MDKRLEEHLERMRQLSARVAQIHEQLAQNTELLTRDHVQEWGSGVRAATVDASRPRRRRRR
jgi:hypothetical protein